MRLYPSFSMGNDLKYIIIYNARITRENTMKKLSALFLVLIILSGCTREFTEDYTVKYKDFLDYTLGDWTVLNTSNEHNKAIAAGDYNENFIAWEIAYEDNEGNKQIFHMENDDPLLNSIGPHLNALYTKKIRAIVGDAPESIYLNNSNLSGSMMNIAYDENPDKLFENYKDIYKFKDITLQSVFDNSPLYLIVNFDFPEALTDGEELKIVNETKEKILASVPNVNMMIKRFEGGKVFDYYINGEKIFLEEHALYAEYVEKGIGDKYLFEEILRNTVPHFDIEFLVED